MNEAIKYYQNLFDAKFPWVKYDQVYVPEFRIRGMENVGVICLSDRMILDPKNDTKQNQMLHRKVVVHELAHMWFGDLVTMQWWNDLWLKEAFADFCACVCLAECHFLKTKFPDFDMVHLEFLVRGLKADLMPSTHNI